MEEDLSEAKEELANELLSNSMEQEKWFKSLQKDTKELFVQHTFMVLTQDRILREIHSQSQLIVFLSLSKKKTHTFKNWP